MAAVKRGAHIPRAYAARHPEDTGISPRDYVRCAFPDGYKPNAMAAYLPSVARRATILACAGCSYRIWRVISRIAPGVARAIRNSIAKDFVSCAAMCAGCLQALPSGSREGGCNRRVCELQRGHTAQRTLCEWRRATVEITAVLERPRWQEGYLWRMYHSSVC